MKEVVKEATEESRDKTIGSGKKAGMGGATEPGGEKSRKGSWPVGSCGTSVYSWGVTEVDTAGAEEAETVPFFGRYTSIAVGGLQLMYR